MMYDVQSDTAPTTSIIISPREKYRRRTRANEQSIIRAQRRKNSIFEFPFQIIIFFFK